MILHDTIDSQSLWSMIRKGEVVLAGNTKLQIFGTLQCRSGKRMRRSHRIFFTSLHEALQQGYRPCGNCMKQAYKIWKASCVDSNVPPAAGVMSAPA